MSPTSGTLAPARGRSTLSGKRQFGAKISFSSFTFYFCNMLKLTAVVSLVLIGSTMWAASLSCDSCGSECTSACGTRHFRSCCFNYLRRKRIPDAMKFTPQNGHDIKTQQELSRSDKPKLPVYIVENIPEQWMSNRPYPYDDMFENRFFEV